MDRIQTQASKVWDLLFASETADTYQSALNLTGTILKETAQLIWLVICSVFVFGAWVSDTSVKTGKGVRDWVNTQSNPGEGGEAKPVADTGKELLDKGRNSVVHLLNQAREQLGLEPSATPDLSSSKSTVSQSAAAKPAATKPAAAKPAVAKPAVAKPTVNAAPAAKSQPVADPTPKVDSAANEVTREDSDDGWPPEEAD